MMMSNDPIPFGYSRIDRPAAPTREDRTDRRTGKGGIRSADGVPSDEYVGREDRRVWPGTNWKVPPDRPRRFERGMFSRTSFNPLTASYRDFQTFRFTNW
jgi:hypothetical protein